MIRWTDPISSRPEPNPRGRPSGSRALDDYLASAYRLRARFGFYDVLVPAVIRLALAIVSLAAVAWLASAWPGTRDDERARDIRPAAGRPLSPAQVERSIALLEGARRAAPTATSSRGWRGSS